MDMERNLEIVLLLDIYGNMLTDKQRDLIDLYYNEDLSLGEIAQHEHITRQGVRDSIKRGEGFLLELEQKLGLLKKYQSLQECFDEIYNLSNEIYEISDNLKYSIQITDNAERIRELAKENLDD